MRFALSLTYDQRAQVYRTVDYKNLGSDELGSIFESLLELHPQINVPARRFALSTAAGNERKTTGSYYTPESLVHALLDSALNPVLAEATKKGEEAILELKVCDPACGSGHFLIAAANRLAKALAFVRTGEEEPPPAAIQEAKRDIISHCIYGVDINPMAVELCKVNLWMEALEPGKPLNFLDHRIQVGNSLLGTTPKLMADGIPDDAFNPIEGDDPKYAATIKKVNKQERKDRASGQRSMFELIELPADYSHLTEAMHALDDTPDDTLDEVRRKEAQYAALASDPEYVKARLLADAWCAAFVWEKKQNGLPMPMTDLLYRRMEENPLAENLQSVREYVVELKERYQFFHWHVAFPDVFNVPDELLHAENEQTGWHGGFSCVLGNPPWERVQLEEKQFFASIRPDIAAARSKDRRTMIADLEGEDPYLYGQWQIAARTTLGQSHMIKSSAFFPLTGSGNVNTFALFTELAANLLNLTGRLSVIVPTSLITEVSNQALVENWMGVQRIIAALDFENQQTFFPDVHSSFRFCILVVGGLGIGVNKSRFFFSLHEISDVDDIEREILLNQSDIRNINPVTLTIPPITFKRDMELLLHIYSFSRVLYAPEVGEDSWLIEVKQMINSSHDSDDFIEPSESVIDGITSQGISYLGNQAVLRLYDGKMTEQYNHRFSSVSHAIENMFRTTKSELTSSHEYLDPLHLATPQYWIDELRVRRVQPEYHLARFWLLAVRRITAATNSRTIISSIIPHSGSVESLLIVYSQHSPLLQAALLGNFNSFAFDYTLRLKMSGPTLTGALFHQQPVIPPHTYTPALLNFIVPSVLELTYTAWDLQAFAQDVGCQGAPFVWDEERRFLMRCELDALYFHLYQIQRDDVDYIMETFPIVKRKDEAAHGEYLTKRIVLEMYDQMAALPVMHVPAPKDESATYAVPDVSQWQTWLNPPPADPEIAHKV